MYTTTFVPYSKLGDVVILFPEDRMDQAATPKKERISMKTAAIVAASVVATFLVMNAYTALNLSRDADMIQTCEESGGQPVKRMGLPSSAICVSNEALIGFPSE